MQSSTNWFSISFQAASPEMLVFDSLPCLVTSSISPLQAEMGAALSKLGSWLIYAVQRRLTKVFCHGTQQETHGRSVTMIFLPDRLLPSPTSLTISPTIRLVLKSVGLFLFTAQENYSVVCKNLYGEKKNGYILMYN